MERLVYTVSISASPPKIWEVLFSDSTFPIWSALFSEGNQAHGTWAEGTEIMILNRNREGVVYLVEINNPFQEMTLRQVGIFKDEQKHASDPEVLEFAGGHENYYIQQEENDEDESTLRIEKDANAVQKTFFDSVFPRALEMVKSMAESEI